MEIVSTGFFRKDAANELTLSNEEDGVGVWLNQYFDLNVTK